MCNSLYSFPAFLHSILFFRSSDTVYVCNLECEILLFIASLICILIFALSPQLVVFSLCLAIWFSNNNLTYGFPVLLNNIWVPSAPQQHMSSLHSSTTYGFNQLINNI